MPPDPGLKFLGSPYPYRSSEARGVLSRSICADPLSYFVGDLRRTGKLIPRRLDPVLEFATGRRREICPEQTLKGIYETASRATSIRASRHKKVDSVMTTNTNEYCLRGSIQVNMMGGTEGIEQVDPHVTAKGLLWSAILAGPTVFFRIKGFSFAAGRGGGCTASFKAPTQRWTFEMNRQKSTACDGLAGQAFLHENDLTVFEPDDALGIKSLLLGHFAPATASI
ncbi:hypothetical protein CPB85DRAFT_1255431 [Mucidula mucida]|nr:hypothetical protein CPB85DRAFT_1255431 [Mucidula mucida]